MVHFFCMYMCVLHMNVHTYVFIHVNADVYGHICASLCGSQRSTSGTLRDRHSYCVFESLSQGTVAILSSQQVPKILLSLPL